MASGLVKARWKGFLAQFVVLFGFWMVLSDQRRPLFIVFGAASALLVAMLTNAVVSTVLVEPAGSVLDRLKRFWWFLVLSAWVIWEIIAASIQVAYFAIHPGLPFRPGFVRFRTTMKRPLSRVVLATAITMVPGTMTVRLDGDHYLVHALLPDAFDDLRTAKMQNMVGRVMGEEREEPPVITWEPIPEAVR
jgi:multicomponent Na+:H+ antiporter subunit E